MIKFKYKSIHNEKNKNTILVILLCILIALFSMFLPLKTYGEIVNSKQIEQELNNNVISELDKINFTELNKVVDEFNAKKSNIFAIENIKAKVYSIISGENALKYENVFASIFSSLVEMVLKYLPLLSIIIAIGVVSNLLNGVKSKFNEKSTSDLISLVCFLAVAVIIIGIITNLAENTGQSISSMVKQMNLVFPILLSLMVGLGSTASVGVFQPIVAIMSTYVADFFNFFIVPLFMLSFVFSIISNISTNIKLDKFSSFISSLFKWSVGLIFTLFFAVFSIQGISAGSFDSIGIRTTKYTIKSYVPVMGGYLSDGMDLILSSSVLIKNSIGLVGILLIISTIISPILEIVVCSLMLKLVSAILQPLGNNKTSSFLGSVSKSITMLSTSIIAIGFMYILSVGMLMSASNMVVWYVRLCVKYFRNSFAWRYNRCYCSIWQYK